MIRVVAATVFSGLRVATFRRLKRSFGERAVKYTWLDACPFDTAKRSRRDDSLFSEWRALGSDLIARGGAGSP